MPFTSFADWDELLDHASRGRALWYQAPLDFRPVAVCVNRVYKNGKIRINPAWSDADPFTADQAHLERFRRQTV